jgi:hypothetical protein
MSGQHEVAPGDHVSRVAATHGFQVYAAVWGDSVNAALRGQRDDPHILAAGDVVLLPEPVRREVVRPTEQRHTFRLDAKLLKVRFRLERWQGGDAESGPTSVRRDGKPAPFAETGPAAWELPVDPLTDRLAIVTERGEHLCRIGYLQPVTTVAGYRERLNNLGYRAGDSDDPAHLQLRSAVEEFQCDERLVVDGVVGPKTEAALVKVHGC